ncbi:MAG: hypothetical protein HRT99_00735 [Mycoplasmatales bacterium]|nr:hypothetical protein [Mycoplasmatales bacterium]
MKILKKKNNNLANELEKREIYLINKPFIKKSSIRGVTLKQNGRAFILVNDNGKRECYYTFSILHELVHLFKNIEEKEINSFVANMVKKFKKESKSKSEMNYLLETFEQNNHFDLIHKNTKLKINFGNVNNFIKRSL